MTNGRHAVAGWARKKRAARAVMSACRAEELERRVFLSGTIAAFGAQVTFGAGPIPTMVISADVNGDGKRDLLVGHYGSNMVSVLAGNGDGTFALQQTVLTGGSPTSLVTADVNGDGRVDLVDADYPNSTISVLLGNGNGSFQPRVTFGVGLHPTSVTAADVNGDGRVDVITANHAANSLSVLLGTGTGGFLPQLTFGTGATPRNLTAADFNRDGKPDLAVVNQINNTVGVLVGNGDGTFGAMQTFGAGSGPFAVVASDVNGDGSLDLVIANYSTSGAVSVLTGNGDGTFAIDKTFAVGSYPESVTVGDVNGDGKLDVVAANLSNTTVSVLLGNGTGTLAAQRTFATGNSPTSVLTTDLNGDGRLDLAVVNQGSGTVGVLLGDVPPVVLSINRTNPPGPITSDASVSYTVTFNEPVTGVDASDFAVALSGVSTTPPVVVSGSGALYTVTINGISGTGTLGLNLVDDGSIKDAAGNPLQPGGTASFQTQQTFASGRYPSSVAVSDVNGDGRPDLVVANLGSNTVSVLLGNGNGTFRAQQTFTAGVVPCSIAAADVNGDGKPDLVVANRNYTSGTVSVLLGNGNGTFQSQQTFATGSQPVSVAVSDLNGDGRPDLVVANRGGTVSVLLGNGNGTFQTQQTFATGAYPRSVAVSDVNGDGRPDLIVANFSSNTVSVLLGNGNGTFQSQQTFASGTHPYSVAVSDVNGDGKPDLVVANSNSNTVSVLLGNGNGTFQAQQTFATGSYPGSVAVSDVNGDGKPDLVVATGGSNAGILSVLLGNGDGTFQTQQTFATGSHPYFVAVSDVNGDGRPDLVVANSNSISSSATVSVLLGNSNGNFTGQVYAIVQSLDTITGTAGVDQITLVQDPDHAHIDWTLGTTTGQMLINDAAGLTINGLGSNDVITLGYTNGNPLPNALHLNGTFTLNNLGNNQVVANPLANTNLEIGRSTVFINYGSTAADAAMKALIKTYLANGYNGGGWTGLPTASTGVITSTPAKNNINHNTGIGWADSSDGTGVNTTANTIELKYTLAGDATLNGVVDIFDLNALLPHFNGAGDWTSGDSTYTGTVDIFDLNALLPNFNTNLGAQLTPATMAATPAASTSANSPAPSASPPPPSAAPTVTSAGATSLMPVAIDVFDDTILKKGLARSSKKPHGRRV